MPNEEIRSAFLNHLTFLLSALHQRLGPVLDHGLGGRYVERTRSGLSCGGKDQARHSQILKIAAYLRLQIQADDSRFTFFFQRVDHGQTDFLIRGDPPHLA